MIKRLGEAATPVEQAAEAAIARVPAWAGKPVAYRPMIGGIMNSNWHVTVPGDPQACFLKIPGPGSEMFIDRANANAAACAAAGLGIGPAVLFFDPADGLEVTAFLDGYRACTTSDFERPPIQEDVLGLYRILNGGPAFPLTKTVFDMIEEHLAQARELGSAMPPDLDWLLDVYGRAKAAFMASGLDLAPCFNDPMPGNFLIEADAGAASPKPMRLIDYEFASNNERAYEIGQFLCEMFVPEDRSNELTELYYGRVTPALLARVWVARGLADVKWAFWAIVNRRLSSWDFDYQKYGDWKFLRARSIFHDSRFEGWLRKL